MRTHQELPTRAGDRPRTTDTIPHAQLDQQPAVEVAAVPLQPRALAAHAEAHVARLFGDAELVDQRAERRIRRAIEDDEAGIDVERAASEFDAVRVDVPADVRARFEQREIVLAPQPVRRDEARNSGSDDGDAHG